MVNWENSRSVWCDRQLDNQELKGMQPVNLGQWLEQLNLFSEKKGLFTKFYLYEMIIKVISVDSIWGWCFFMWAREKLILMPTSLELLKSAEYCHFAQYLSPSPRRWALLFSFWETTQPNKNPHTPKPKPPPMQGHCRAH